MRSYSVELQLTVDTAGGDLGEMAYRWLDGVSMAQAADIRAAVGDQPARRARDRFGEFGGDFGYLRVDRRPEGRPRRAQERIPSREGMAWLRRELADVPWKVTLEFGHLDDTGFMTGARTVLAARHDDAPHRVVLTAYVSESELADPGVQRFYLDLLRGFADEMNPAFGHIAYPHDGRTAFEAGLRNVDRVPPPHWWSYPRTLAHCREALRGYSWLTILPQELLDRVGGLDTLTTSGAFVEVRQLAHGGIWLLSTDDYRTFDDAALLRVFQALAPALRPGPVTLWPPAPAMPPLRVVPKDAGRANDPATPWWWTATVEYPAPVPVTIEPVPPGEIIESDRWSTNPWWVTTLMVETAAPPDVEPVHIAQVLADALTGGMLKMLADIGYVPDAAPDPHLAGSPLRSTPGLTVATFVVRLRVAYPQLPEAGRIFAHVDTSCRYAWKRHYGGPPPVFVPVPANAFNTGYAAATARRSSHQRF